MARRLQRADAEGGSAGLPALAHRVALGQRLGRGGQAVMGEIPADLESGGGHRVGVTGGGGSLVLQGGEQVGRGGVHGGLSWSDRDGPGVASIAGYRLKA